MCVAVLPTGYGKSLCYACLPIVFDQLQLNDADTVAGENGKSIVAVVTPLTAIMEDQVLIIIVVFFKLFIVQTLFVVEESI